MGWWHLSRLIALICALAPFATGQIHVHFGVEAGVPLTDTLSSSSGSSVNSIGSTSGTFSSFDRYNSETKRFLIGPAFRVEMQSGLGIEFDALYQRIDYDHATLSAPPPPGPSNQSFEQTTANRWQFPLLIQYTRTLSKPKIALFVETGPSISRIASSRSTITMATISNSSSSSSKSSITGLGGTFAGIVGGGGVDIPLLRAHLRPEFRYSHWFSQNATFPAGVLGGIVSVGSVSNFFTGVPLVPSFRTTQNEASFLLGLTF